MNATKRNLWGRDRRGLGQLLVVDCIKSAVWEANYDPPLISTQFAAGFLSKVACDVLGAHGISRFEEFWSYPDGWDFGEGKALSPDSVVLMDWFLKRYRGFGATPSLFLTRAGHLMLGWEDADGESIEMEFGPSDGFLLYTSASDEERAFTVQQLPELLEALPHATR